MSLGVVAGLLGSSLIGSLISAYSAKNINKQNIKYQEEANQLAMQLANTAHQREVYDLQAAGLNPILSAGGAGASTPQLGTPDLVNPAEGLSNSAVAVGRELARYASAQYEQSVDSMAIDNNSARSSFEVQREQDKLDALLLRQKRQAIEKYLDPVKHTSDGRGHVSVSPDYALAEKRQRDVDKWLADGYISDIKLRGNANWRSNLSSFVPFVNSAASVGSQFIPRTTRRFYK